MIPGKTIKRLMAVRERRRDALCGPRVGAEDRIHYVLQSELLGPAPREEGSSDSGDEFLIVNADWLSGAAPLQDAVCTSFGHTL